MTIYDDDLHKYVADKNELLQQHKGLVGKTDPASIEKREHIEELLEVEFNTKIA